MECYNAMTVSKSKSEALEKEPRQQSINNIWHRVRSPHLTSSSFKRAYSRKADYEQLATSNAEEDDNTANQSNEERPGAWALEFSQKTKSTCPPLRYISWQESPSVWLQQKLWTFRNKLPDQYSSTGCQYLQKHSGDTYSLKRNYEYYYRTDGDDWDAMVWLFCEVWQWLPSGTHSLWCRNVGNRSGWFFSFYRLIRI